MDTLTKQSVLMLTKGLLLNWALGKPARLPRFEAIASEDSDFRVALMMAFLAMLVKMPDLPFWRTEDGVKLAVAFKSTNEGIRTSVEDHKLDPDVLIVADLGRKMEHDNKQVAVWAHRLQESHNKQRKNAPDGEPVAIDEAVERLVQTFVTRLSNFYSDVCVEIRTACEKRNSGYHTGTDSFWSANQKRDILWQEVQVVARKTKDTREELTQLNATLQGLKSNKDLSSVDKQLINWVAIMYEAFTKRRQQVMNTIFRVQVDIKYIEYSLSERFLAHHPAISAWIKQLEDEWKPSIQSKLEHHLATRDLPLIPTQVTATAAMNAGSSASRPSGLVEPTHPQHGNLPTVAPTLAAFHASVEYKSVTLARALSSELKILRELYEKRDPMDGLKKFTADFKTFPTSPVDLEKKHASDAPFWIKHNQLVAPYKAWVEARTALETAKKAEDSAKRNA